MDRQHTNAVFAQPRRRQIACGIDHEQRARAIGLRALDDIRGDHLVERRKTAIIGGGIGVQRGKEGVGGGGRHGVVLRSDEGAATADVRWQPPP